MKSRWHEHLGDILACAAYAAGANLVVPELFRIDRLILLIRGNKVYRFGGEVEMTERHCIANCLRNFEINHCDAVIIACPDEKVKSRVNNKIAKHLPEILKSQVIIFTKQELLNGFLSGWIESVAGRGVCPSH